MSEINVPAWQLTFNLVQGLLTLALFFYTRRVARHKAAEERLRALEERMDGGVSVNDLALLREEIKANCARHQERTLGVERRTADLRIELEHLPAQRQIDELNKSINALFGELKNTQGRLEGINRAVDLINEFLINRERG
jgi:chromosome segregation ATPase